MLNYFRDLMIRFTKYLSKLSEPSFSTSFYCRNCYNVFYKSFPVGTDVIRTRSPQAKSRVVIPKRNSASIHKDIICTKCQSSEVT